MKTVRFATVQFFTAKSSAFDPSRQSGRHGDFKSFRSTSLIVGVSQLKLQNLSKKQCTRKNEGTNMMQNFRPANRGINTHELNLPVRRLVGTTLPATTGRLPFLTAILASVGLTILCVLNPKHRLSTDGGQECPRRVWPNVLTGGQKSQYIGNT